MSLAINLSNLGSRAVRLASTNNGIRRIAINATASKDEEEGGLLGVYNTVNKFGRSLMSFAFNKIQEFFSIDWKKLFQQAIQGVRYILNFDINKTDKQIEEEIKQAEIAIASAKGSLAGQSLGFILCGIAPAATIAVFNKPLALYAMKEVGQEAAEEISASLANLVRLQSQQSSRIGILNLFKNNRDFCRNAAIGVANLFVRAGILTQESVDKANKERNRPWSIASSLEDSIDSIKDPESRAFWEELWDELGDSCIEAGYIVAGSIDSYFAMQKMANESLLGDERIIEIQPIRNPDEDT